MRMFGEWVRSSSSRDHSVQRSRPAFTRMCSLHRHKLRFLADAAIDRMFSVFEWQTSSVHRHLFDWMTLGIAKHYAACEPSVGPL
jgi:hypothetical protein